MEDHKTLIWYRCTKTLTECQCNVQVRADRVSLPLSCIAGIISNCLCEPILMSVSTQHCNEALHTRIQMHQIVTMLCLSISAALLCRKCCLPG